MTSLASRTTVLSRLSLPALAATTLLLTTGCPDPKSRFNDFEGAVIDAAVFDARADGAAREIPDITGQWYLGFTAPDIESPENVFHIRWVLEMTKNPDGTASLDLSTTNLTYPGAVEPVGRQPVGETTVVNDIVVTSEGRFEVPLPNYVVPEKANPVTFMDLTMTMVLAAEIKSADIMCGQVAEGMVHGSGLPLAGGKFIGQRVPTGSIGGDLPPVLSVVCPDVTTPDAGVPDGGGDVPDAGVDADVTPDADLTPDAT